MLDQDEQRVQALLGYRVLDTATEQAYDDITELTARYFDAPIALVGLLDGKRQWFKSRFGFDAREIPRAIALCDLAIRSPEVMVVEDTRRDPRLADHPMVKGPSGIAFYAGAPLVTPQGHALGTLCVLDHKARQFSAAQRADLASLARQVMAQLELRKSSAALSQAMVELRAERDRLHEIRLQLEGSQTRMSLVLKGSNDAWWDWNLVTGEQFYSPRGWEMLGYENEELPYDEKLWEILVYPADRAMGQRNFAEAIDSGGERYSFEMRLRHKDGHPVPVLSRGYILRDEQGKALRVSGTDTDLTERRQAERALRAEQQLNEQIFANSPIGICIFDSEGNCISANESIARQVGASVEQLRRQNFHQIESWKVSGIYDLALKTIHSGEPTSNVLRVKTTFGKDIWCLVNFRALPAEGIGRLMLMTDDLTDFKLTELGRKEIQDSYEMLFLNSMDGVLQSRPDGAVLSANPAACAMLGMSEEELRRRGRQGILDSSDPRLPGLLELRRRTGRARGEIAMIRGNGERFDVEITSAIYRDGEGRTLASTMFRDVSERRVLAKKVEDSLNLLHNLAQRVPGVIYQYQLFPDGRSCFPFASEGIWGIYEVKPEQVREDATLVFQRLHPEDYDAVSASISVSASTLQEWEHEYRVILPQQGVRWRHGKAQPEMLPDGSILWHGCITDVTERKQAEANTHRLAYFDALTGLPNRRMLLDRIVQSLASARRSGQLGALLFLDLDNFKRINDARGHSVGDSLLALVAKRLTELLRNVDMVARLGGDEFVVLVNNLGHDPESAAVAAMAVAERMRQVLETPYLIDGYLYSGTGSIGLTMFPKNLDGVDDLLREADTAMYRAKASGRNRIAYFEAAMQAEVEERLALEHDLKVAIAADHIEVHVQSQVDASGAETGGELLLRWNHPVWGNVPPARFIPIAEESGLILQLGDMVVRQACEALARMQRSEQTLSLSVNISPRQFRQDDFVERIRSILVQTEAPASRLIFEVTEGLLIENWEDVATRMTELAAMGIRFSIDDFGLGYSSLAYLKRLPLHELKIDKSFVQDAPDDPNDAAIVRTILAMAKNMKLRVVAEGVETQAQADFLVEQRCDFLQGFLFSRPTLLESWLSQRIAALVGH